MFSDANMADTQVYLLLDTADSYVLLEGFPMEETLRALRKRKERKFVLFEEANMELYRLVEGLLDRSKGTIKALFTQQAYFLSRLLRSKEWCKEWS